MTEAGGIEQGWVGNLQTAGLIWSTRRIFPKAIPAKPGPPYWHLTPHMLGERQVKTLLSQKVVRKGLCKMLCKRALWKELFKIRPALRSSFQSASLCSTLQSALQDPCGGKGSSDISGTSGDWQVGSSIYLSCLIQEGRGRSGQLSKSCFSPQCRVKTDTTHDHMNQSGALYVSHKYLVACSERSTAKVYLGARWTGMSC